MYRKEALISCRVGFQEWPRTFSPRRLIVATSRRVRATKMGWTVLAALAVSSTFALAQDKDFPNRPLRVIFPFGAGNSSDGNARFFAEKLTSLLA